MGPDSRELTPQMSDPVVAHAEFGEDEHVNAAVLCPLNDIINLCFDRRIVWPDPLSPKTKVVLNARTGRREESLRPASKGREPIADCGPVAKTHIAQDLACLGDLVDMERGATDVGEGEVDAGAIALIGVTLGAPPPLSHDGHPVTPIVEGERVPPKPPVDGVQGGSQDLDLVCGLRNKGEQPLNKDGGFAVRLERCHRPLLSRPRAERRHGGNGRRRVLCPPCRGDRNSRRAACRSRRARSCSQWRRRTAKICGTWFSSRRSSMSTVTCSTDGQGAHSRIDAPESVAPRRP